MQQMATAYRALATELLRVASATTSHPTPTPTAGGTGNGNGSGKHFG